MRSRRQHGRFEEAAAQNANAASASEREEKPKTAQSAARYPGFNERVAHSYLTSARSMRHPVRWSSRSLPGGVLRAENLRPQERPKTETAGVSSFAFGSSCGSIFHMPPARTPPQRMPNHSVNLTRNSAPRWPSEARYAHNAPLVHRVALPRAGYLKR
jgi:hypothetical protein